MKRVRISFRRHLLLLLLSALLGMPAFADNLLRDGHPQRYTVVKGDTLWDIAGRFLRSPWRWPDIWHVNPQVKNPHLIYPGDILELVYVDGKPQLRLTRGPSHIKLSPEIRSRPWDGAIPTIPVDAISPFLTLPYVLNEGEGETLPYIVSFADRHIIGGAGQKAYVRSVDQKGVKFHVVRPGEAYRDAETGEILGYQATYIGRVESLRTGDPGTVFFNNTERESLIGDRLVSVETERPWTNFIPKRPNGDIEGSIISVVDGLTQIGQYNVVVIDRGERDGLTAGDVLRIDQRGATIRDIVVSRGTEKVTLPDEQAGLLMVFRTFERVSYGLVMNATSPLHVLDRVRTP